MNAQIKTHRRSNRRTPVGRRPQGAILAVGLMIMLVISMTAVFALSGAVMQERMVGAVRNESIADNGTDSALRDGERWIWEQFVSNGREVDPMRPGTPAYVGFPEVEPSASTFRLFRNSQDWVNFGRAYGNSNTPGGNPISSSAYHSMPQVPRFVIEYLGKYSTAPVSSAVSSPESHGMSGSNPGTNAALGQLHYYRITARSTGGTEGVIRTAESTFTATF